MTSGVGPTQIRPASMTVQRHAQVRLGHKGRVTVAVGVDRHGEDPHFPRCAEDAPRDLSTVGDQ